MQSLPDPFKTGYCCNLGFSTVSQAPPMSRTADCKSLWTWKNVTSKGKRLLHAANKRLDTKCLERKLVNLGGLLVGISPSLEVFKGPNQFCTNVTSLPNTQMTQKKYARCSELLPHTNAPAVSWVIFDTIRRVPTRNRSKRCRIDISSPWSRTFPVPSAKLRLCPESPPCLR